MSTKLFVGNLDFKITAKDLQEAFAPYGTVVETKLVTEPAGRSRGFGFVTMSSGEEAQKAIEGLEGKEMGGRSINVSVARPREARPTAGPGGRRERY